MCLSDDRSGVFFSATLTKLLVHAQVTNSRDHANSSRVFPEKSIGNGTELQISVGPRRMELLDNQIEKRRSGNEETRKAH